jgi:hypothetical protein
MQTIDPTKENHSMCFPATNFRVPSSLWGAFSCFIASKPTAGEMMEADDMCLMTPIRMNSHCDACATNEESMLDWEGNMRQQKDRSSNHLVRCTRRCCSGSISASFEHGSQDNRHCPCRKQTTYEEEAHPCWKPVPRAADQVSSVLASVSPTLNDQNLHERLAGRANLGMFKASIGSTNALGGKCLVKAVDSDDDSATDN